MTMVRLFDKFASWPLRRNDASSKDGQTSAGTSSADVPASGLNFFSSPRSIFSSPRSVLSTTSSLLSARRERQALQKAARAELFQQFGSSIRRDELRQLSRGQLRQRLLDLGAASTEGEGMMFSTLVDTVLLWNALNWLQDYEHWGTLQEESLEVCQDPTLPIDLLRRVLMVIGVPWAECQGLNRLKAAVLLREKLIRLKPTSAYEGMSEDVVCEQEHLRSTADGNEVRLNVDRCPENFSPVEVAESRSEEPHNMEVVNPDSEWRCCDEQAVLETVPQPAAIGLSRDAKFEALDSACRVDMLETPPRPASIGLSRESKFEAFDTALTETLSTHVEINAPRTPPLHQSPPSAKIGRREAKFDLLDAHLAECLDEEVTETSPLVISPCTPNAHGSMLPSGTDDEVDIASPMLESAVDVFVTSGTGKKVTKCVTPRLTG